MNNVVSVQLHFILTICTKNKIWGGYFPAVANFYVVNFIFFASDNFICQSHFQIEKSYKTASLIFEASGIFSFYCCILIF